jgi:hypothetical protein
MIKLVGIYRNITDMEAFLKIYTQQIFPVLHKTPGVLGTDIMQVNALNEEGSTNPYLDIEVIIETHFQSEDALDNLLQSPQGLSIAELVSKSTEFSEVYLYYGRVKRVGTYGF